MNRIFFRNLVVGGAVAVAAIAASSDAKAIALLYGMDAGTGAFAGPVGNLDAAYSCSHSTYGEGGSYMTSALGNASYGSTRSTYTAGCKAGHTSNAAGTVVASAATLRAATVQTVTLIGNRINQVRLAQDRGEYDPVTLGMTQDGDMGTLGLAGGNAKKGIGVWVQGSYTWVENDATISKFDGNVLTGMVGVDYKFNDRFMVGISGGYESTDLDTTFNKGNLDATGYMVAPYLSFRFNKNFSVDATGGYAWLSYDMDRKDAANNQKWTGSTDATRSFGAIQLNADHAIKKWNLSANIGALYSSEEKDQFIERSGSERRTIASQTTDLGQGFLGGRVGYDFGVVMPYVLARAEWDFSKDEITVATSQVRPDDDDFGLRLGAGLNIYAGSFVTGTIQGETVLLRDDYTEHKALAKIRVDF